MKRRTIMMVILTMIALTGCGKKSAMTNGNPRGMTTHAASVGASPAEAAVPVSPPQAADSASTVSIKPSKREGIKYFPEGTPTREIQDLDDMIDSYIINPKTPEEERYNVQLKAQVLTGTFDIRELCALALDKHWAERTPQEQDYFVNLMKSLLERKAIFSKEQGQKNQKKKDVSST